MVAMPPPFGLAQWLVANQPKVEYNLGVSEIQTNCVQEILHEAANANLRGGSFEGELAVRAPAAAILGLAPEELQLTAGTSEANFLTFLCAVRAGQQVVVEEPTYSPLLAAPAALEHPVVRAHRDPEAGFALPAAEVERALQGAPPAGTGLVVITNLNNPTGAAMGKDALRSLGRLCADFSAHVFIDETFRWLDLAQTVPLVAACRDITHPDGGSVAISSGSLSKAYNLGASRIGWLAADDPFLKLARGVRETMNPVLSPLCEHLAAVALERHDKILDRTLALVGRNRKIAKSWAEGRSDVRWVPSNGITAFPEVTNAKVNLEELAQRLVKDYSTLISPGAYFGYPRHFRLGLGGDSDKLVPGLERVGTVLDQLGRA